MFPSKTLRRSGACVGFLRFKVINFVCFNPLCLIEEVLVESIIRDVCTAIHMDQSCEK
jgi:hypothetical protein